MRARPGRPERQRTDRGATGSSWRGQSILTAGGGRIQSGCAIAVNDIAPVASGHRGHDAYDELVLWFEHDVFDQLNLIQLLTWIRDNVPPTTPVSLICIGSFPGRPDFKGLGELTPNGIGTTHRRAAACRRTAVQARGTSVGGLSSANARGPGRTSARGYVGVAVSRSGHRTLPAGISLDEGRTLAVRAAPSRAGRWRRHRIAARVSRMQEGEQSYSVTDGTLEAMANDFGRVDASVADARSGHVERSPSAPAEGHTHGGRAIGGVGELDRIATCGIDKWLGGVHLRSGGTIWRWDETRQRVVN